MLSVNVSVNRTSVETEKSSLFAKMDDGVNVGVGPKVEEGVKVSVFRKPSEGVNCSDSVNSFDSVNLSDVAYSPVSAITVESDNETVVPKAADDNKTPVSG